MAQIKAQKINWLDRAWFIGSVIAEMPTSPPKTLPDKSAFSSLEEYEKLSLESLQTEIGLHLAYRIRVVHKVKIATPDGGIGMFIFDDRNPDVLQEKYAWLKSSVMEPQGKQFDNAELMAIGAQIMLGQIMLDGYVCLDWHRLLPLTIASIGGQFTGQKAAAIAEHPRNVDRRSPLAKAIANERGKDRFATAMEVLDRLCGGEVVKECKDSRVWYWSDKDELTSVGLRRFETIFGEQKPSTG